MRLDRSRVRNRSRVRASRSSSPRQAVLLRATCASCLAGPCRRLAAERGPRACSERSLVLQVSARVTATCLKLRPPFAAAAFHPLSAVSRPGTSWRIGDEPIRAPSVRRDQPARASTRGASSTSCSTTWLTRACTRCWAKRAIPARPRPTCCGRSASSPPPKVTGSEQHRRPRAAGRAARGGLRASRASDAR